MTRRVRFAKGYQVAEDNLPATCLPSHIHLLSADIHLPSTLHHHLRRVPPKILQLPRRSHGDAVEAVSGTMLDASVDVMTRLPRPAAKVSRQSASIYLFPVVTLRSARSLRCRLGLPSLLQEVINNLLLEPTNAIDNGPGEKPDDGHGSEKN